MSPTAEVPLGVLLGGGVESTVLVKQFLAAGKAVLPVHVNSHFPWEAAEAWHIRRFCRVNACDRLHPLLEVPCTPSDELRNHWTLTRTRIPQAGDAPSTLEIPLRNSTLLRTAARALAHLSEVHLVMGTTADNSFSDGTRAFFDDCEQQLSQELRRPVRILTPLLLLHKVEVIRLADPETLALGFSCLQPQRKRHCGRCYKCGRRQAAFAQAGVPDPTVYCAAVLAGDSP